MGKCLTSIVKMCIQAYTPWMGKTTLMSIQRGIRTGGLEKPHGQVTRNTRPSASLPDTSFNILPVLAVHHCCSSITCSCSSCACVYPVNGSICATMQLLQCVQDTYCLLSGPLLSSTALALCTSGICSASTPGMLPSHALLLLLLACCQCCQH